MAAMSEGAEGRVRGWLGFFVALSAMLDLPQLDDARLRDLYGHPAAGQTGRRGSGNSAGRGLGC